MGGVLLLLLLVGGAVCDTQCGCGESECVSMTQGHGLRRQHFWSCRQVPD
jgi:hypothetical protein